MLFRSYRVYPTFYQLEPCIFIGNKALKKLSPTGRTLMLKLGEEWERTSYDYWKPLVEKERAILSREYRQKEITLTGAAAAKYLGYANNTPIERLKKVETAEAKILGKLYHGQ